MASSGLEVARLRTPAKELKRIEDYLAGEALPREEKRRRVKVFLSYCERNTENQYLIEDLVNPFLEGLDFEVHYYKKDMSLDIPFERIDELIDSCDVIIGFYTRDKENTDGSFSAADNVISEMNYAREKKRLALVEKGTILGSLDFTKISNIPFTREEYGKLLVNLLRVLKNSGLLNIKTSIKAS